MLSEMVCCTNYMTEIVVLGLIQKGLIREVDNWGYFPTAKTEEIIKQRHVFKLKFI